MRADRYFTILMVAVMLHLSCQSNSNQKISTATTGHIDSSAKSKDSNDKNDFASFFNKFRADSNFQKSRIIFPLKYIIKGDEGTADSTKMIAGNQMNFIALFISKSKSDLNQVLLKPGKRMVRYQLEDTGYEKDFTFEKREGDWYLVLITDNSD